MLKCWIIVQVAGGLERSSTGADRKDAGHVSLFSSVLHRVSKPFEDKAGANLSTISGQSVEHFFLLSQKSFQRVTVSLQL